MEYLAHPCKVYTLHKQGFWPFSCKTLRNLAPSLLSAFFHIFLSLSTAPPVLSDNSMLPAILDGTLELTFTISEARPPVAEEDVIWTFLPSSAGSDLEPIVLNSSTSDRYQFLYMTTYVRLTIHPVQLDDEGNYSVSVSNIAGEDMYTLSVDVVSKCHSVS